MWRWLLVNVKVIMTQIDIMNLEKIISKWEHSYVIFNLIKTMSSRKYRRSQTTLETYNKSWGNCFYIIIIYFYYCTLFGFIISIEHEQNKINQFEIKLDSMKHIMHRENKQLV